MLIIDIVFIILIVLMITHGFIKGFVAELFSWAALVLSIWAAVLLFPAGGAFIRTKMMEHVRVVPELLAFIGIFLCTMIMIRFLERILRTVVEGANLGAVNRFLGAVFGLVEGLALTVLAIFVLRVQPLFDGEALIEGSFFDEMLAPLIRIPLERGQDIVHTTLLVLPAWMGLSV